VLLLSALAAGICLDRWHPLAMSAWMIAAVIALATWLGLWLTSRERAASCLLLLCVLATGGAWHHAWWRMYPADEVTRMLNEDSRPACIEAIAITSPRWIPAPPPDPLRTIPVTDRSELLVRVVAVRDGQQLRPASGRAQLVVGGMLDPVQAGDRLLIMGQAAQPRAALNPGEFDFAEHERSRRVGCRLFAEFPQSVLVTARGGKWSGQRLLAALRSGGSDVLRRYIAPERAMLASAVLLGTREQLEPDRNEGYLVTGTIHVLSISGLHVGILAALLFVPLRVGLTPRTTSLVGIMLVTLCYAALVDFEPPVMRATILVIAACLALWSGRTVMGFNTLAAAGLVVLAINPASVFLAGTQLSFLAVATMIAFQPLLVQQPTTDPLDRLIATTRPWLVRYGRYLSGLAWRAWLAGALIWLMSTPLVWKQYNLISPVALVLNFAMMVPVTIAMYAGFATLTVGSLVPAVGMSCGPLCDQCLLLLEQMIAIGRTWPGSYAWWPAPPRWWVAGFYVGCGMAAALPAVRPSRSALVTLAIAWTLGAFLLAAQPQPALRLQPRPLACHFVAVGHGIAVLIELPDGQNLLYDAGHLGSPLAGVRSASAVLWSRGLDHLDAVIVSHADADHFNALPELLERFSVGVVYVSPVMFNDLPPAVAALNTSIERAQVPIQSIYAGQSLVSGGGATLEVLHPPQRGIAGSNNANSIVLAIEYAGRRVLLTGDLEPPGLAELLKNEPLDCDVILAPHHGSPRSNPGGTAPPEQHTFRKPA
jgi:competence protein ComEC